MTDSTHRFERDRLFKKWGQFKPFTISTLQQTIHRIFSRNFIAYLAYFYKINSEGILPSNRQNLNRFAYSRSYALNWSSNTDQFIGNI